MPVLMRCDPSQGAGARCASLPVFAWPANPPMFAWSACRRRLAQPAPLLRAALLLAALLAPPAQAHKSSDAYLFIDQQAGQTTLRWDIALRDLDQALPIDADGDRTVTWGEVRRAWPRIDALALQSLAVGGCRFQITGHALEQRNDGAYAVLQLAAPCQVAAQAQLHYSLFLALDPTHRGIVRHTVAGASPSLRMLVPAAIPAALQAAAAEPVAASANAADVGAEVVSGPAPALATLAASALASASDDPATRVFASPSASLAASAPVAVVMDGSTADAHTPSFISEGIHHILTGYDHLLFLLCLLLPAVLRREPGPPPRWLAVTGWRQAVLPVAKTVTLFTLAHSVTLALAALGWVKLSPTFVEPAIAATIMLAAFDNLRPLLLRWRGWVTFTFGLIHGFGFAGVLGELQLPPAQFGWALFQFNLGLELGQLAMVAAVVPLLYWLRQRPAYVPVVLRAGSGLALLLALVWLVERSTDWRLLSA